MRKTTIISSGITVLLIGAASGAWYVTTRSSTTTQDTAFISNNKTFTVSNGKDLSTLQPNSPISGLYKVRSDEALFYTVTTTKKELIDSGTILGDKDGRFSRNVSLPVEGVKSGTPLELKIYTQSSKGTVLDQLAIKTTYH